MLIISKQNARISYEKEAIDIEKTRLANYHRELALLQQVFTSPHTHVGEYIVQNVPGGA